MMKKGNSLEINDHDCANYLKSCGWESKTINYHVYGHKNRVGWRHPALGKSWKSLHRAIAEQEMIDKWVEWCRKKTEDSLE